MYKYTVLWAVLQKSHKAEYEAQYLGQRNICTNCKCVVSKTPQQVMSVLVNNINLLYEYKSWKCADYVTC